MHLSETFKLPTTPEMKRRLMVIRYNWKTVARSLDLSMPLQKMLEQKTKIISDELDHWIEKEELLSSKKRALELKLALVCSNLKNIKTDHDKAITLDNTLSDEVKKNEKALNMSRYFMFNKNILLRSSCLTTYYCSNNFSYTRSSRWLINNPNSEALYCAARECLLRDKLRNLVKRKIITQKNIVEV